MTDKDVIEIEIKQINEKMDKVDIAIEKLSEVSTGLSQMIMVHETKIDNVEALLTNIIKRSEQFERTESERIEKLHDKISTLRSDAEAGRKELKSDVIDAIHNSIITLNDLEKRVSHIENWRWKIAGMGAIVIVIIPFLIAIADWVVNHMQ